MGAIYINDQKYNADLVIFDKDGTLLDFGKTWIKVVRGLIVALEKNADKKGKLKQKIEAALGISVDTGEVDPFGPLAMGTFTECDTLISYCLYSSGIRWDRARDIVHSTEQEVFAGGIREHNVVPADGSLGLLKRLKQRGIRVAVATNDNVTDTTRDMESIGVLSYIDLIVGADRVDKTKPDPEMVYKVLDELGIDAGKTILVGDMLVDTLMGKNAGVMLTVGVCGLLPRDVLEEYADVVITSLNEIQ